MTSNFGLFLNEKNTDQDHKVNKKSDKCPGVNPTYMMVLPLTHTTQEWLTVNFHDPVIKDVDPIFPDFNLLGY